MRGYAVLTAVLAVLLGTCAVAGCGGDDDDAAGGDTSGAVKVDLAEAAVSGQTGTATLIARGEQTHVSIEIDGEPVSDSQPANIYEGNCGSVPAISSCRRRSSSRTSSAECPRRPSTFRSRR